MAALVGSFVRGGKLTGGLVTVVLAAACSGGGAAGIAGGTATCDDPAGDHEFVAASGNVLPAPPEAEGDLVGAALSVDEGVLTAVWTMSKPVHVEGDVGPVVAFWSGPFTMAAGPYTIWAFAPGGTSMVFRSDEITDAIQDPSSAGDDLGVFVDPVVDGTNVAVTVDVDDLPDLADGFTWTASVTTDPISAGAPEGTIADGCGVTGGSLAQPGGAELAFPGGSPSGDDAAGEDGEDAGGADIDGAAAEDVVEDVVDGSGAGQEMPTLEAADRVAAAFLAAWVAGELEEASGFVTPEIIATYGDPLPGAGDVQLEPCTGEPGFEVDCAFSVATSDAPGRTEGVVHMTADPVGARQGASPWVVVTFTVFVE